jgi:20S proteasome alpha/beta subunit
MFGGGWAPIGAERTSTGYEVAWKVTGADQYSIWYTDSSGNFLSTPTGVVSGSSAALELLEPSFQQDLNGDGVIGPVVTTIESNGATSLLQVGNNYLLGGVSGVALSYQGALVVAGEFGNWAPIAAEQTASGYEVAWKVTGADQYSIWNTDSSGRFVSSAIGVVSGSSAALELLEPSFHQDLNGDGVIGPVMTTIGAPGSTTFAAFGGNYFLGGAGGAVLKYAGAPVVAGQFGDWAPIGAEQTASGYEVAWKVTGADQYSVWYTDSSGNFLSTPTGAVSGASAALELLEPSFHQDLNGDGVIGPVVTTIESNGATSLLQVGNNYLLGGLSGVALNYMGAPVVAGEFGGWAPIAAEQTSGGYEVAWKVTGADQYSVWNTDSSGHFVSSAIGVVSGSSTALQSLEPSFHQDLNGDGVIGPVVTTIESNGATSLLQVGNNYLLGGLSGAELNYMGSPVVAGEFGGWAPIAAEQTSGGYEVAWKVTGADQYSVWNTDSSGHFVSSAIGVVSGSSTALESLEPSFHQDLNGDGVIGLPPATSSANSSTFMGVGAGETAAIISYAAGTFVMSSGTIVSNPLPASERQDLLSRPLA